MGFWDDVKQQMSELSKEAAKVIVSADYIGGHPGLESTGSADIGKDGNTIFIKRGITKIEICREDILGIRLERADSRHLGKAVAGALIGTALTAGIGGLLVGGAIGGRKKDNSIVIMTVNYNGMQVDILFGGKDIKDKYPKFSKLLK